jgi:fatty acid desaturase
MEASLKSKVKELTEPDVGKFAFWLAFDFSAAVLLLVSSALVPLIALPLIIFLIGVFQHRIALIGHDLCHVRLFKTQFFNRVALELIGHCLFITEYSGYRDYHLAHHSHVGSEHDPELHYRKGWGHSISLQKMLLGFFADLVGLGIVSQGRFMFDVFPTKFASRIRLVGGTAMLLVIAWSLGWLFFAAVWVIALSTSFWAIFRVRAYLEHVGIEPQGRHTSHRFFASVWLRPIFFPHSTWCHYEHHLFPTIPFHNLVKLRQLLDSEEYKPVRSMAESIADPR